MSSSLVVLLIFPWIYYPWQENFVPLGDTTNVPVTVKVEAPYHDYIFSPTCLRDKNRSRLRGTDSPIKSFNALESSAEYTIRITIPNTDIFLGCSNHPPATSAGSNL